MATRLPLPAQDRSTVARHGELQFRKECTPYGETFLSRVMQVARKR
jgi:hypothetical protein